MSISSSLSASVSGLNANAQRLSSISDNIANSSTTGYRRLETDFHSMVVNTRGSNAAYTAGGVRTTTTRLIDNRGQTLGTANATDISIQGRGFLPVTDISSVNNGGVLPLSLMTTGSFRPDKDSILKTVSGQVLMGWPLDSNGTLPNVTRDTSAALKPVDISLNQYVANRTTDIDLSVNLPASESSAGSNGDPLDLSIEYFGNLSQPESLSVTYTPTVPATGSSNTWTMQITDSASAGAVVGEYTLTFSDDPADGGTLASVTTTSGGAYDPATGFLTVTTGGGDIDVNIGTPGDTSGTTQLYASFAPSNLGKNGSPVGTLVGVEITEMGVINAIYDTGFNRAIYQVPLIDVPNTQGLISQNDQTYQLSAESGPMFLWNAGDGPTGTTLGYSLEASATDVAVELTNLIQTQRAYSSNAKVIQTVDEMLQETTNIKR